MQVTDVSVLRALIIKTLFLGFISPAASLAKAEQSAVVDLAAVVFAESNNDSGDLEALLNLNYKFEKTFVSHKWMMTFEGDAFAATYPELLFAVPELRIFYKTKETEVSIGRKKIKKLNLLDQDWNLGVQTSFFRMDPFSPKKQGLLGLNYQIETDQIFIDFFASPIFIPDQNPSLDLMSDGNVEASSPWVFLPPTRVDLSTGGSLEIDYALIEDSLPELLTQHQFGGRFGVELKDLSILGMYYNRPSRQLDFDVSAKIQAGESEGFVSAQAKPLFLREHFYGIQGESTWFDKLSLNNGFYGIIQEESEASDAKIQTKRFDYFFISTALSYEFIHFNLSLKHLLTKKRQVGLDDDVIYFENSRFLFENALMLEVSKLNFKKIGFKLGGVYSYKEKVAQFYARGTKQITPKLQIYSYLNIINDFSEGLDESEGLEFSPTGIGRYAALDNFRLGVAYAF